MIASFVLATSIVAQPIGSSKTPDEIIEIREPEYSSTEELISRFYCLKTEIQLNVITSDLGMRVKGSYFAQVLFNNRPISYGDLSAINQFLKGRTVRRVSLTYCDSRADDHTSEVSVTVLKANSSELILQTISLRFLDQRLVSITGDT